MSNIAYKLYLTSLIEANIYNARVITSDLLQYCTQRYLDDIFWSMVRAALANITVYNTSIVDTLYEYVQTYTAGPTSYYTVCKDDFINILEYNDNDVVVADTPIKLEHCSRRLNSIKLIYEMYQQITRYRVDNKVFHYDCLLREYSVEHGTGLLPGMIREIGYTKSFFKINELVSRTVCTIDHAKVNDWWQSKYVRCSKYRSTIRQAVFPLLQRLNRLYEEMPDRYKMTPTIRAYLVLSNLNTFLQYKRGKASLVELSSATIDECPITHNPIPYNSLSSFLSNVVVSVTVVAPRPSFHMKRYVSNYSKAPYLVDPHTDMMIYQLTKKVYTPMKKSIRLISRLLNALEETVLCLPDICVSSVNEVYLMMTLLGHVVTTTKNEDGDTTYHIVNVNLTAPETDEYERPLRLFDIIKTVMILKADLHYKDGKLYIIPYSCETTKDVPALIASIQNILMNDAIGMSFT